MQEDDDGALEPPPTANNHPTYRWFLAVGTSRAHDTRSYTKTGIPGCILCTMPRRCNKKKSSIRAYVLVSQDESW